MEDRRLELGLGWREVADRASVSYEAVRALRKSGKSSQLTKHRVELALGWVPGSIDVIARGGEPAQQAPPDELTRDDLERIRETVRALEEQIADALRRMGR